MSSVLEVMSHLPPTMSEEFCDYVNNTALLSSRYLFIQRIGKKQMVFCSHCRNEWESATLIKENTGRFCHFCNSHCLTKNLNRGRKKLIDSTYVLWYEKSIINSNALVARGVHVKRDYSGDYRKVDSVFNVRAEYLFIPGNPKGKGKERLGSSRMIRSDWPDYKFREAKSIISELDNSMQAQTFYMSEANIDEAIKGTPFQYSQWKTYFWRRKSDEWHGSWSFGRVRLKGEPGTDMVKYFGLYAKYPCVEYLTKMNLDGLIDEKMEGKQMHKCINWRGESLEKVFRLSKMEIKDMMTSGVEITSSVLHSYRFFKDRGVILTFNQSKKLQDITNSDSKNAALLEIGVYFSKAIKYVLKQLRRPGANKRYDTGGSVLITWRDYLKDCRNLGYDVTKESTLFPNNLDAAHKKTIELVRIEQSEALNSLITKRFNQLKKFTFEANGFLIRPIANMDELFNEGKELKICVGGYAEEYAGEECDLFVIRRTSEPDVPFFTMEIIDNFITQTQGFDHCLPTPEVKHFLEQLVRKKRLNRKQNRLDKANLKGMEIAI
ncbi:MAG: hypothetical protein JWM44_2491 [Bacilli bacterium]|nr:hypothetical protein [Bacilli bacterium]